MHGCVDASEWHSRRQPVKGEIHVVQMQLRIRVQRRQIHAHAVEQPSLEVIRIGVIQVDVSVVRRPVLSAVWAPVGPVDAEGGPRVTPGIFVRVLVVPVVVHERPRVHLVPTRVRSVSRHRDDASIKRDKLERDAGDVVASGPKHQRHVTPSFLRQQRVEMRARWGYVLWVVREDTQWMYALALPVGARVSWDRVANLHM